jgi:DNA-binding GntR family transcriptional regulator
MGSGDPGAGRLGAVTEASKPFFPEVPRALTKTDLAYEQIRQAILEGTLKPGSNLDQEVLAEQLELSTTPVREALRRLESERLVVRRAHRDTVVAPLSMTMVEESFSVRLALDPLAVSLAASKATAEERKVLQEQLFADEPGPRPLDRVTRHRQLHAAMYGACHNALLVEMLDSLWDVGDRYRLVTLALGAVAPPIHQDHGKIIEAVIDGRARQAAKLMREHTAKAFQTIRDAAG